MPAKPLILEYPAPPVPQHAQWHREPGQVRLTLPPPPLWRLVLGPTLATVGMSVVAGAFVAVSVARNGRWGEGGPLLGVLLLLAPFLPLWFVALAALFRTARHGRQPTVVTVSAAGVDVDCPTLSGDSRRHWRRSQIIRLRLTAAVLLPLFHHGLRLSITGPDGEVVTVRIPWRGNEPVKELEDGLRDAVGLPPR